MKPTITVKQAELKSFYTHLQEPGYTLKGCTLLIFSILFRAYLAMISMLNVSIRASNFELTLLDFLVVSHECD